MKPSIDTMRSELIADLYRTLTTDGKARWSMAEVWFEDYADDQIREAYEDAGLGKEEGDTEGYIPTGFEGYR